MHHQTYGIILHLPATLSGPNLAAVQSLAMFAVAPRFATTQTKTVSMVPLMSLPVGAPKTARAK